MEMVGYSEDTGLLERFVWREKGNGLDGEILEIEEPVVTG